MNAPQNLMNDNPWELDRAHAVHPISAIQSEYSLVTRWPEDELLGTLDELGIGFVPFSPLGRGLLTASKDPLGDGDFRKSMPRFSEENFDANRVLADRFAGLASAKGCTAGQLALAWVLAQGRNLVPIPGTRRVSRLIENAESLSVELSEQDLLDIEELDLAGSIGGARFSEALEKLVGN